jgi:hypothetical protein
MKDGKLLGIIQFAFNFTESLVLFSDEEIYSSRGRAFFSENGMIEVFLDQSSVQRTLQVKREIYDAYQRFMEGLMTGCGLSKTSGNIPIIFESLFGSSIKDSKLTIVVGLLIG